MNNKINTLAKKIDSINYEYDYYSYMDNLDTTDTIYEGRLKATKEVYIDLIEGNIEHYIGFLKGIIAEGIPATVYPSVGYSIEQVQEISEELIALEEV